MKDDSKERDKRTYFDRFKKLGWLELQGVVELAPQPCGLKERRRSSFDRSRSSQPAIRGHRRLGRQVGRSAEFLRFGYRASIGLGLPGR